MGRFKDLTGQRFERLVVTGRAPDEYTSCGNKKIMWYCDCDCGTKNKIISGSDLRDQNTKSCGCLNIEKIKERMHEMKHQTNKYDLSGEFGIGWTSKGEEFWFDLDDYEKIKDYCWYFHHTGYLVAKDIYNDYKMIMFHKIVFDDGYDYTVDHIVHKLYDCRKNELRKCTRSQNNKNRGIMKNNTSGVTGVYWHSRDQLWIASINIDENVRKEIARTTNFEEAVSARKEAEERYYGEWSYDNSMEYAK